MNALARFWQRGADDADRRVAAIFTAPHLRDADRYLASSAVVRRIDSATRILQASLATSQVARWGHAAHAHWQRAEWSERYRMIGLVLITAVAVHVAATLMQTPHRGWFHLIAPALVAVFAAILLMASTSPSASRASK